MPSYLVVRVSPPPGSFEKAVCASRRALQGFLFVKVAPSVGQKAAQFPRQFFAKTIKVSVAGVAKGRQDRSPDCRSALMATRASRCALNRFCRSDDAERPRGTQPHCSV